MAGIGRDGLMVALTPCADGSCELTIERDGGKRVESWPSKERALERAAALMVRWHSEEVGE